MERKQSKKKTRQQKEEIKVLNYFEKNPDLNVVPNTIDIDPVKYGNNIIAQRKVIGMTQSDLAKKVGISTAMMNKIEKGKSKDIKIHLVSIADALRCSPDFLLSRTDTPSKIYDEEKIGFVPIHVIGMDNKYFEDFSANFTYCLNLLYKTHPHLVELINCLILKKDLDIYRRMEMLLSVSFESELKDDNLPSK